MSHRNMGVDLYKSQYDSEMLEKQQKWIEANNRRFNIFNKREIEKVTKHINNEMDEGVEEFYKTKKDKEKDDGLSLWAIVFSYFYICSVKFIYIRYHYVFLFK